MGECPCQSSECQKTWNALAPNDYIDDEDYIIQHCECHTISYGKTSFHCEGCGVWVCQDCAHHPDFVCGRIDQSNTFCKRCFDELLNTTKHKTKQQINKDKRYAPYKAYFKQKKPQKARVKNNLKEQKMQH